jgi:hypothetical protein
MPDDVLLPAVRTLEQFEAVRRDDARLRPGVTAICDRLGLRGLDLVRFPDGSMPVYAVGDQHVLKLYPSVYRHEGEVEHRVLQAVEGRLPTPTPRVHHVGEFDGWGYVLMDRLHGASLAAAWPRIGQRGRVRLAAQLGETLAALHATVSPVLTWLGPPDWDASSSSSAPAALPVSAPAASTRRGWRRSRLSWTASPSTVTCAGICSSCRRRRRRRLMRWRRAGGVFGEPHACRPAGAPPRLARKRLQPGDEHVRSSVKDVRSETSSIRWV